MDDLFRDRRPGHENIKGLDSLYLGPSGRFFLLRPHTHDETARSVLRAVHPELLPNRADRRQKAGGYEHTNLTLVSGIQRVRIYSAGVGVTVERYVHHGPVSRSSNSDATSAFPRRGLQPTRTMTVAVMPPATALRE